MPLPPRPQANRKLRAAREAMPSPSGAPGLPMSRRQLAEVANAYVWHHTHGQQHTNMTEHDIGRYERGEVRWPGRWRRLGLRGALRVATDKELGLYPNRRPATGPTSGLGSIAGRYTTVVGGLNPSQPPPVGLGRPTVDPSLDFKSDHDPVVETVPKPPLDVTPAWPYPIGVDRGWAAMLRWVLPDDAVTEAARSLAGARSDHPPSRSVDPNLVQCLLTAAEGYRRSYHAVPSSQLLPAALTHLNVIMSLRPAGLPDRERVPLITAAGEMAALVGVLLALDASRFDDALKYFELAWIAARSVEDVELQAVVLGCRSFATAYGKGDHRAGLDCADFAREVAAAGACSQTRAWVAAVASERCASLGDLAGCQRRLDESQAALAVSVAGSESWRGIGGYDSNKLRAYEGGDLIRLRRYRDAEPILDEPLAKLPAELTRHRATALLDRAEARFGLGDLDAACDDAGLALGLVVHVQHTGHLDRIESLARRGIRAGSSAAGGLHRDLQFMRADHGFSIRMGVE